MKKNISIETLTKQDVERLSERGKSSHWAISFYLGIKGDRNFISVANSFLSQKKKEIDAGSFSKEEKLQIRTALDDIKNLLKGVKLPDLTRTLVIFISSDDKVIGSYSLPIYTPTKLVVEKNFFIHPFIKKMQQHPRYAVLALGRDRARIFSFFWGELEDAGGEIRSEVPQRMNAARATWKGLEERKIQNHIEVHINRHLKKVAQAIEDYMMKEKIPYLVIGSRRELIERFSRELSGQARRKIVGSYFVRSDQSLKRIKEESVEVIGRFESGKENNLISKLLEGSSKKTKGAALGVEAVLDSLENYKVRDLVVGKDFARSGFMCEKDGKIYLSEGKCFSCGGNLSEVGDIGDEMIEIALAQKIKITHLLHSHADFDGFGVGAILK